MENLKSIIESLLFVTDDPISFERLKTLLPEVEKEEIKKVLSELIAEHETRRGGFYIIEVAKGFQFRSRPEYREWIARLIEPSPVRLSKAALETLAIIAYRQPVIRADIEHIRGVDSGGIIRMLLERKLVRVLGRKDIPGRPLIYATTNQFLELFGLRDLKDLPTLKEIQEFGQTSVAEVSYSPEDMPKSPGSDPDSEAGGADNLQDGDRAPEQTTEPKQSTDVEKSDNPTERAPDLERGASNHPTSVPEKNSSLPE